MVEWETKLTNLRLDNNQLHSLNGALSGLRSLLRLNLSCNSLSRISPDDLIGLDSLTMLDISHNQLTTLEETSKVPVGTNTIGLRFNLIARIDTVNSYK